jgi:CheY-like chemotaxis protein
MAFGRQLLASVEPTSGPSSSDRSTPATGSPSVLLVRNLDTRLLLRGLLRLQRYPVVFEADRPEDLDRLPEGAGVSVIVIDQDADEADWNEDVRSVLARRPELRPILLTSDRSPEFATRAASAGVRAVVVRPFQIRELAQALETAAAS